MVSKSPASVPAEAPDSESFVRAFARGLTVIDAMGRGLRRKSIAQVAEASGLPRSVAKRLLLTLCEQGYAENDGRSFMLTPKVLSLGLSYLYTQPYWPVAQAALEDLRSEVGESCSMAVLHGTEIVYVLRVPSRRILATNLSVGSRLPAHQVSIGRVLLAARPPAEWRWDEPGGDEPSSAGSTRFSGGARFEPATPELRERIRRNGYAWVDGVLDTAIAGIGVPVRDAAGQVIAGINVSLIAGTCDEQTAVRQYLVPLRRAAEQIRATMPRVGEL